MSTTNVHLFAHADSSTPGDMRHGDVIPGCLPERGVRMTTLLLAGTHLRYGAAHAAVPAHRGQPCAQKVN